MSDLGLRDESIRPLVLTTSGNSTQAITPEPSPPRMAHVDTVKSKHRKDKKSLDYVLRSGLAGGVAGCAVSVVAAVRSRLPQAISN